MEKLLAKLNHISLKLQSTLIRAVEITMAKMTAVTTIMEKAVMAQMVETITMKVMVAIACGLAQMAICHCSVGF